MVFLITINIWSWPTGMCTHLSALHPHTRLSLVLPRWTSLSLSIQEEDLPLSTQLIPVAVLPFPVESVFALYWIILISIKHSDVSSMFSWCHFSAGCCPNSWSLFAETNLKNCLCSMSEIPRAHFFLKPTPVRFLPSLFTRAALVKVTKFLNHQSLLSPPTLPVGSVWHGGRFLSWFPWLPILPVFPLSH